MKYLLFFLLFIPSLIFGQCDPLKGCENGYGVYTFKTGGQYNGNWKEGVFHGKGTYLYSNGDKYMGLWKNNLEDGKGVFINSLGDKYDGSFKKGNFDGYGVFISVDGNKYDGYWKENKFHGQGSYFMSDKSKFIGQFKENNFLVGKYFYKNGDTEEGEFQENKIWNGSLTIFSEEEDFSGLIIKYFYKNGLAIDSIDNSKNYYNIDDIIGYKDSQLINLVDRITKYDLELEINNMPIIWRFDTGAETTSVSFKQWDKIKENINYEDLNINRTTQGVGGTSTGYLVKILDDIKIGEYAVKNFIVCIVENDFSLLGIDFLQKFSDVQWNMKEAHLLIYK